MLKRVEKERTKKDIRYLPSYSVSEAALYLQLPISTLRAWVGRQSGYESIINLAQTNPIALSFINLVESYVLASIRRTYEIPMPRVRRGIKYIRRHFDSEHPLAEKDFETNGLDLFLRESGTLVNISQEGQTELDIVKQYLRRIERDTTGLPIKLYPFTRTGQSEQPKLVIIDPHISFGRPVLVNRGIPVSAIAERYKAGESIEDLMFDYDCAQKEIEEAIRCEVRAEAA